MKSARALRIASRTAAVHTPQALVPASLLAVRHVLRTSPRASAPCLSYRPFSMSARTLQEQQTTFPDPERADLWYHLFEPPTPASGTHRVFAVSLASTPPPTPSSSTIIGWLPAEPNSGRQEAGLNDFVENATFRHVLHDAIKQGLAEGVDDIQVHGALQLREGWMHINDQRNVPALGRIGDPDDILGSVRVEDGKIMAETYEAMPAYRLCTSDGVIQLTDGLANKLRHILEERARVEARG
ncbi:hypothetical protein PENSPDRAFT_646940 [Peniophora sp. CONT]|nr:hypothetical protein PENSPDRAFT_646940 [Peniophora sp. CONT]